MSTETELDARLRELDDPANRGDALDRAGFVKLVAVALVLPIVMLVIGWVAM